MSLKFWIGLVTLAWALVGCSHHTEKKPQAAVANPEPDRLPAGLFSHDLKVEDIAIDFRRTEWLPTSLYKNEHWKKDREAELDEFNVQAKEVLVAQSKLMKQRDSNKGARVFHQKQQGCLIGTLHVRDQRDNDSRRETYRGMFAAEGKRDYTVLARFSGGIGKEQADIAPDVRGMAIKILGVHDEASNSDKSVDLTMTNSITPFGHDQAEFVEFMKANVGGKLSLANFIRKHPTVGKRLISQTFRIVPSLTTETYFAGHPYLMGSDAAAKFHVVPAQKAEASAPLYADASLEQKIDLFAAKEWAALKKFGKKFHKNYLSEDLATKASAGALRWTLYAQMDTGTAATDIEDSLQIWDEKLSPSVAVADIEFPVQDIHRADFESLCESASFTPGHGVSQHRALGNMGRGRIFAYKASSLGRGASMTEVEEPELQKFLQH